MFLQMCISQEISPFSRNDTVGAGIGEGCGNVGALRPRSHTPFTTWDFVISMPHLRQEKSIVLSQVIS